METDWKKRAEACENELAAARRQIAKLEEQNAILAEAYEAAVRGPPSARVKALQRIALDDGERVYRTSGTTGGEKREFAAIWNKATAKFVCEEFAEMGWETEFDSPTNFARACTHAALGVMKDDGLTIKSVVCNGWDVCYVKRGGKRVYLRELRAK